MSSVSDTSRSTTTNTTDTTTTAGNTALSKSEAPAQAEPKTEPARSADLSVVDSFERVEAQKPASLVDRMDLQGATDPAKVEAFAATLSHQELTDVLATVDSPQTDYGAHVSDAGWQGLSQDLQRRFEAGHEAIFESHRSGQPAPGGVDPLDPGLVDLSRQTVRMGRMGGYSEHLRAEATWRREATMEAELRSMQAETRPEAERLDEVRGSLRALTREVDLNLPSALGNRRLLEETGRLHDAAQTTDAVEGLTGLGGLKHAADVAEMEDPSVLDYVTGAIGAVTAPFGLGLSAATGTANVFTQGKFRELRQEVDRRVASGEIPASEAHRLDGRPAPRAVDAINVAALAHGAGGLAKMARRTPKNTTPRARTLDELTSTQLDALQPGRKLGAGAHSDVYELPGDRALVLLRSHEKASAEAATHLQGQLDHMAGAGAVRFEGTPVAPRIDAKVTNEQGELIGYVAERIPGRELGELAVQGELTDAQFAEVVRQLEGQRKALHDAGLVHGDPNLGNVLVNITPDGGVQARLLDFEPPGADFGPAEDAEMFGKLIDEATFFRQPEQVAAHRARQAEAVRAQLLTAERANAGSMRGLLRAQRRGADGAMADQINELLGALPTREPRVWRAEDFQAAHQALMDSGAQRWLQQLEPGSELRAGLETALRNWAELGAR